tara:strand:- start:35 stop:181 length:147 start_codon:yes stop_codon:yes gene_type:complete
MGLNAPLVNPKEGCIYTTKPIGGWVRSECQTLLHCAQNAIRRLIVYEL